MIGFRSQYRSGAADRRRGSRFICTGLTVVFACIAFVGADAPCNALPSKKKHYQGSKFSGCAKISDLGGNVAGSNISGTNVWVRMYVQDSWANTEHNVSVKLGGSVLAAGLWDLDVRTAGPTCPYTLVTSAGGDWQSSGNKGWVKFDTTSLLSSGNSGDLKVVLSTPGHSDFASNTISNLTIYNRAYVLANSTLNYANQAADAAHQSLEYMNHLTQPVHTANESDSAATIASYLSEKTVFYIDTHGGYDSLLDDMRFADCHNADLLYGFYCDIPNGIYSVHDRVGGKTEYQPAYNFVFIDACYSAGDGTNLRNVMAKAFEIISADGTSKADRAYLGWKGLSYDSSNGTAWVTAFFDFMSLGYTVSEAVNQANHSATPPGTPVIIGDGNTTLHMIYNL